MGAGAAHWNGCCGGEPTQRVLEALQSLRVAAREPDRGWWHSGRSISCTSGLGSVTDRRGTGSSVLSPYLCQV